MSNSNDDKKNDKLNNKQKSNSKKSDKFVAPSVGKSPIKPRSLNIKKISNGLSSSGLSSSKSPVGSLARSSMSKVSNKDKIIKSHKHAETKARKQSIVKQSVNKNQSVNKLAESRQAVERPIRGRQMEDKNSSFFSEVSNGYFLLGALVAVMCMFGLMMVLSASSVEALREYKDSWFFFKRQVLWILIGVTALLVMSRIDYRTWRSISSLFSIGSVFLLILVLIPHIGIVVYGSRRWLGAGMFRMQPSELAKFAVLIFSADLLTRRAGQIRNWRLTMRPVLIVFFIFALLIMLQPDMGTTMILASIVIGVLFVSGIPMKHMTRLGLIGVGVAGFLAIVEPYRRERLTSFTDPFKDASDTGYQLVQSLVSIGSGGITGVGLGASRAKWGFLPNAHTDFIFAIIAEELGLIGATVTVLLFVAFAVLGIRTASKAPDQFGTLVASGLTIWVVFQAFVNMGAVIGILPITGVPLPFLSQGGSSLVILMAATGILLNIAKQGEAPRIDLTRKISGVKDSVKSDQSSQIKSRSYKDIKI